VARPRQISDELILETARRCFFEHGPGVSTDVIAGELGVSPQALFKRFSSKRDLMLASVRPPAIPPWTQLIADGPDERPFHIQLKAIVSELAKYFEEIARRMSLIRWSGIPMEEVSANYETPPPIVGIRALADWLQRAHNTGLIRRTDYQASAMSLLGSLHAPTFLEDILGQHPTGHTREQYVSRVVDLYARGLAREPMIADELRMKKAKQV
jgi:AcrR family transcriptional regulator